MDTSLKTPRTVAINQVDFLVKRDGKWMGKPRVPAGATGGTGNGARRRTKLRPWTRIQAR